MSKVRVDRLLRLAALLEADADNPNGVKFDLGQWAVVEDAAKLDCKTTACAIGLACLSGEFKKDGLSWRPSAMVKNHIRPVFLQYAGFTAVEQFFGLNLGQSGYLFTDESYPKTSRKGREGELAVATRIREFCAEQAAS